MGIKINNIEFISDISEIIYLTCHLNDSSKFDIELYDFYHWLIDNVANFKTYSDKFQSWSELTNDLITLEFDFLSHCKMFIESEFEDEDISMFSYN